MFHCDWSVAGRLMRQMSLTRTHHATVVGPIRFSNRSNNCRVCKINGRQLSLVRTHHATIGFSSSLRPTDDKNRMVCAGLFDANTFCKVQSAMIIRGKSESIYKFADDTKLFRKVKEIGDKQKLQDDIDKLVKWSEKWQMLFNFGKCKCLHTGSGNTGLNYEMGGTILSKTVKEKDLGVTMNANMEVSGQCRIAASKGNQVLGMIRRNITYKDKSLIMPLYKAIVRPHLEYCIQAWNPYLRKDVDMLEKIQRRATKLIPGLRDLTYEERLNECGLTTLETRRLRGDQLEVFKILNGYENIDSNLFFRN